MLSNQSGKNASQDYYTRPRELELVTACLGRIDLDPCANPQRSVPAAKHYVYAEGQDGLALPWGEKVAEQRNGVTILRWRKPFTLFLNPPWNDLETWTDRLLAFYAEGAFSAALMLVPVRTERPWFQRLKRMPVWFPDERINYMIALADGTLKEKKGIAHASCIFNLGVPEERFERVFSPHGRIYECRGARHAA